MIEVLWHGRGGQGAFTAARLLGAAATLDNSHYALAFPSFGPERRGAPMRAFTKISDEPIGDRSAIHKADYVVYLDGTLLPDNWEAELKDGGLCLVNATEPFESPRLLAIDADGMSTKLLGRPIPNTVFLGAIAALEQRCAHSVSCEQVNEAIHTLMPAKLHEKNIALVGQAYALVQELAVNASACVSGDSVGSAGCIESSASASEQDASSANAIELSSQRAAHSSAAHMPRLYTGMPTVSEYAHTTCYTAGFLTQTNAGWRNKRPVVDDAKCTGCLQCYMVCPDGVIYKTLSQNKAGVCVSIDLDFCKGCGVCANACKFAALQMKNEQELLAAESEVSA